MANIWEKKSFQSSIFGFLQAIRFFVMETLKDKYRGGDPNKKVPKLIVGLMGGFAGACSVFGNTPIDVVKTRMQGIEASRYKNTLDCARQIMLNEGPKAFYKGTNLLAIFLWNRNVHFKTFVI